MARKCEQLGLLFSYDWSNPEISDEALVINVLKRGIFEDICRVCAHFGVATVERLAADLDGISLPRMMENIRIGLRASRQLCATSGAADDGFSAKACAIHGQVRSRDLADLKAFVEVGKTIEDILRAGPTADPACSMEYAKSVLVGDVPLDIEDEGVEIEAVYRFFRNAVNEHEQAVAAAIFGSAQLRQ